jgi:hypothetical protein
VKNNEKIHNKTQYFMGDLFINIDDKIRHDNIVINIITRAIIRRTPRIEKLKAIGRTTVGPVVTAGSKYL